MDILHILHLGDADIHHGVHDVDGATDLWPGHDTLDPLGSDLAVHPGDVPWVHFASSGTDAAVLHHDIAAPAVPDVHAGQFVDGTPWLRDTLQAAHQDTDRDGIADALDHHFGPGADAGPSGEFPGQAPWLQTTPAAVHQDADRDSIPDALDNHFGPGAHAEAPGEFPTEVPWLQATPAAAHQDADRDGIPDALDDRFGPGSR